MAPGWYRVRRTVKFSRFLITGGVIGFVIGALFALTGPTSPRAGTASAVAFMGVTGVLVGLLVSGAVAVLLDRRA